MDQHTLKIQWQRAKKAWIKLLSEGHPDLLNEVCELLMDDQQLNHDLLTYYAKLAKADLARGDFSFSVNNMNMPHTAHARFECLLYFQALGDCLLTEIDDTRWLEKQAKRYGSLAFTIPYT